MVLQRGGLQLPNDKNYEAPLYARFYPRKDRVMEALDNWTARFIEWGCNLQGRLSKKLTVDILVRCCLH